MWLELIHLRAVPSRQADLAAALSQLRQELARDGGRPEVRFFRNALLPTDYSVLLLHRQPGRPRTSDLGLLLASALENLGMIESSIWVGEDEES